MSMQLANNAPQIARFVLALSDPESRKRILAEHVQQRVKEGSGLKPRILNISYNEPILRTRHAILEESGFEVVSALGFAEGLEACTNGPQQYDLAIFGPSLPAKDKGILIGTIRNLCGARILSLRRPGSDPHPDADYSIDSGEGPERLVAVIKEILGPESES